VLWLLSSPPEGVEMIKSEVATAGLDQSRIVFHSPLPRAEHFARLARAHLLLDTRHYNSHTSAADALWLGLPLLTFPALGMQSRVAASLATAVGCAVEMVVQSWSDYEERAVKLATDFALYSQLRTKLEQNRFRCPLFDTRSWVGDFERLLLSDATKSLVVR